MNNTIAMSFDQQTNEGKFYDMDSGITLAVLSMAEFTQALKDAQAKKNYSRAMSTVGRKP